MDSLEMECFVSVDEGEYKSSCRL